MTEIQFTIPILPPSKNTWQGRHWFKRYKQGDDLQQEVWAALIQAYPAPLPSFKVPVLVELEFHFPDNRPRDVQNYEHPGLYDALVTLGVIVDDSAVWMSKSTTSVVDGRRATTIRIREKGVDHE
jgi:Holliday junction resolvase RusA-like endonuclease